MNEADLNGLLDLMVETPCLARYNRVNDMRLVATTGKEKTDIASFFKIFSWPSKRYHFFFVVVDKFEEVIRSSAQR